MGRIYKLCILIIFNNICLTTSITNNFFWPWLRPKKMLEKNQGFTWRTGTLVIPGCFYKFDLSTLNVQISDATRPDFIINMLFSLISKRICYLSQFSVTLLQIWARNLRIPIFLPKPFEAKVLFLYPLKRSENRFQVVSKWSSGLK